jgi:hypothetical protein
LRPRRLVSTEAPTRMNLLSPTLPVIAACLLLGLGLVAWWMRSRRLGKPAPLPREWALAARPVFSTDERRVYRALREALPHHVVLSKLPLVRFCQPTNPDEIAYWYDLLGTIHVTFAICSANGRVLAAIDLDTERGISKRVLQIKQAVLGTCRVRYLRCPVDHLPSVAELQLLVPQNGPAVRAPQPAPIPAPHVAAASREANAAPAAARRGRTPLWQDSGFFHDSFFAPDNRSEAFQTSDTGHPASRPGDGAGTTADAVAGPGPQAVRAGAGAAARPAVMRTAPGRAVPLR